MPEWAHDYGTAILRYRPVPGTVRISNPPHLTGGRKEERIPWIEIAADAGVLRQVDSISFMELANRRAFATISSPEEK